MLPKIIITGPPRCGKSTLISKLIDFYKDKKYVIHGFLTPEVRKENKRIGFDILDINSRERTELARIEGIKSPFKLGKYNVFVENLELVIKKLESLEHLRHDLIIIDEIGKMELFSKKFQNYMIDLFKSNLKVIATIGQKMQHSIKNFIMSKPNVICLNLNRNNQKEIFQKILSIIQ